MNKSIKIFMRGKVNLDQSKLVYNLLDLPREQRECVLRIESALEAEKLSWQSVIISAPEKKRSTGYRSQESHVRGHCESISEQVGGKWTPEQVLEVMKGLTVLSGRDYPAPEYYRGIIIYPSNASLSSTQENSLIETIHQWADENDCWLIEYSEEQNPRAYKSIGGRSLPEMMKHYPDLNPQYRKEQFDERA